LVFTTQGNLQAINLLQTLEFAVPGFSVLVEQAHHRTVLPAICQQHLEIAAVRVQWNENGILGNAD
jgi:DNA-binding transcriptional MocR family regulator